MNLPVSYKQFAKDPVKAVLFIAVLAIGYLYLDNKAGYIDRIESQELRIEVLESNVKDLQNKLLETVNKI